MTQVWQGSQKCFRRISTLFVDPFGATQQQIEQCRDVTRALVRKHYPAIGKWTCSTVGHPKQQDTTSCLCARTPCSTLWTRRVLPL
ncbi:hypothetical protein DPEC_G00221710 [Dallia pectoralis]|uniref:Uncharacterized protein n=1 Tax=Dallia pectoralis TaxID=75939 RepID=A0ACC2G4F3_DALPE|nr:hypothetical protein DPEC_G00221710 [Dallia pectoralis]